MSRIAFIDFETKSEVDIKKAGADVYVRHPSTDAMCMGFCIDDEKVEVWKPHVVDSPSLPILFGHIKNGGAVVGHNIGGFDLLIWNEVMSKKYGWPSLSINQITDTMAESYAMALPGSLENAAAAVGLEQKKDMAGNRIMRQLSQPRSMGPCTECLGNQYRKDERGNIFIWNDLSCSHCKGSGNETIWYTPHSHPEKFQKLYDYCAQDLEVTRELYKRTMRLSHQEQSVWRLDHKINQRGIAIDLPAVKSAIEIVNHEKKRLDNEMREVTGNAVAVCSAVGQIKEFITNRGVSIEGLAKADVVELLSDETLPQDVRRALELRQEAAKTSTAKLEAMLSGVCSDGRVRGTLQYHGASTGRWSARRVQIQNLPKPKLSQRDITAVFELIKKKDVLSIEILYGSPLSAISDCLRGFIVAAPGHELIAVDYSSIESRVLAWLAGEEKKLGIFRGHGKIYEHAAAGIYGVDIDEIKKDDPRRQIGKVAELALGYQGGKRAFQVMAKTYGVKVTDEQAEAIKIKWRNNNPNIVKYWYDLENAAISAVLNPGKTFRAGFEERACQFRVNGSFLWCRLPSGRVLCYPYPKIQEFETPWGALKDGLTYMGVSSMSNKWERQKTYSGALAENCCQALSRDLLAEAMLRLEYLGHKIIFTVHDELVIESPIRKISLKEIEQIACELPAWAAALPVKAEGRTGTRYGK